MSNEDIMHSLVDIECALYYRIYGDGKPEGIKDEDLRKAEEVITDADKYFLLNDVQFYSHRDFCNDIIIQHMLTHGGRI